jgi:excisionase family DNA binding protein
MEEYITTREAARRLGVTLTTVTRWCQAGKLAGARLRNKSRRLGWRIPVVAVELLLDDRAASA